MNLADEIFSIARGNLSEILMVPPDKITLETRQNDIENWDSMQQINIMLALEQSCGVHFKPEDFLKLTSVAAIIDCIQALKASTHR